MRFKGVLFDLDGTLLDTTHLIIEGFKHTMRVHYDRDPDLDIVRSYFGKPLRAAFEELGPGDEDKLVQTYREHNLAQHDALAKVFAGVAEVVQKLSNSGVRLAIVTSKTHATSLRGLKLFNLDKYFPVLIGHEQCTCHKPHPEPVNRALEALGLAAGDCLMVGDSPFDIISARSAGVKTAAVRWTYVPWASLSAENPDYILETMADLLTVCRIKEG